MTIDLSEEEADSARQFIEFALRASKFLFDAWGDDYSLAEKDQKNANSLLEKLKKKPK